MPKLADLQAEQKLEITESQKQLNKQRILCRVLITSRFNHENN